MEMPKEISSVYVSAVAMVNRMVLLMEWSLVKLTVKSLDQMSEM